MTNMRKAFRLYKFLRGFKIRVGFPHKLAMWIAKHIFPPNKLPPMKIEQGWINESAKNDTEEKP